MRIKTVLISVYHKDGIGEWAQELVRRGCTILASGGTAKTLIGAKVPVTDISDIVGEAILGHRVVTIDRKLHAGILARDIAEDLKELERLGMERVDVVCVDLYPLEEEIAKPGSTRASVIEKTDVGGPTLLHSAAKGERIVICDPADRQKVLDWMDAGCPDEECVFTDALGGKAEATVAHYTLASARYRSGGMFDGVVGVLHTVCKYGENAWQKVAGLYRKLGLKKDPLAIHNFKLVAGDTPSCNNLIDLDRALQTMTHTAAAFIKNRGDVPDIALVVKHGNACGAGVAHSYLHAIQKMVTGNPLSMFGGVVMTNFDIHPHVAEGLLYGEVNGKKNSFDAVVASHFPYCVHNLFTRKGGKCRLLENPALAQLNHDCLDTDPLVRQVRGGYIKQDNYTFVLDLSADYVERFGPALSAQQEDDLLLAWAVGSTSNSNTITLVKDGQLIGNGVGQQDRVGCCNLALKLAAGAGHDPRGAVAYSDSFFPFPDGPEVLAEAGISAIFSTSGSRNDHLTKEVCATHGVSLVMVPDTIGRGFFNH